MSEQQASTSTSASASSGRVLYVFCVTYGPTPIPLAPGLTEDAAVSSCSIDEPSPGLAAVVCEVVLADWTGEVGEAHLKDLKWLGPRAMRHEQIIEEVMAAGPVLPLRFGCIFSGETTLRAWLAHNHAAITEHLSHIAGLQEWSIKGWLHPERAAAALAKSAPPEAELPSSPGARYLRERKQQQTMTRAARDWGRTTGAELLTTLRPFFERHRMLSALPGSASARDEEVAFHFALLVGPTQLSDLHAEIERLGGELSVRGLELAMTGPWPPYSFCPNLVDPSADAKADEAPAQRGD